MSEQNPEPQETPEVELTNLVSNRVPNSSCNGETKNPLYGQEDGQECAKIASSSLDTYHGDIAVADNEAGRLIPDSLARSDDYMVDVDLKDTKYDEDGGEHAQPAAVDMSALQRTPIWNVVVNSVTYMAGKRAPLCSVVLD